MEAHSAFGNEEPLRCNSEAYYAESKQERRIMLR
jgi:hypothetical protein